jgi:hypothetical protein
MPNSIRNRATVGSVSRKVMELNPDLGVQDIIYIIKQSVVSESGIKDGFTKTEVIDEHRALALARMTLKKH